MANHRVKYTWKDRLKAIGPAAMVTGSFIGPGTVTTSTQAGASFGYGLLWAIIFATVATIVLQEMAARLGIVTGEGLSEGIMKIFDNPVLRWLIGILIGGSITLGCIAYIGGDLTGVGMGLAQITGLPEQLLGPIVGVIILLLVMFGSLRGLEKLLMGLVALMALIFVITMIVVRPDVTSVFTSGLAPTITEDNILLAIAIVGTTMVPYNFYIHAGRSKQHFGDTSKLELSRWDTYVSIGVGGLITAAIMITAATVMLGHPVESAADLAIQLEPTLGPAAETFISIGLVAAGFSSAIVVPLGASFVLAGVLGWKYSKEDKRFYWVNIAILVFGIIIAGSGQDPVTVIVLAQALNGIILPLTVICIVYLTSTRLFMNKFTNNLFSKVIGVIIALISLYLGAQSVISAIF